MSDQYKILHPLIAEIASMKVVLLSLPLQTTTRVSLTARVTSLVVESFVVLVVGTPSVGVSFECRLCKGELVPAL